MQKTIHAFILFFLIAVDSFSQQQNLHQIQRTVSESPSVFLQNKGQWNADVFFRTSVSGADVSFLKNGLSFAFQRQVKDIKPKEVQLENLNGQPETPNNELLVWNLNFKNSNAATITSEREVNSHSNYFFGEIPSDWKTNVPAFGMLTYKNIYNNVDLRYYRNQSSLEYDYIIHPNSNASQIEMQCNGINALSINRNGELEIETAWGILKEKKPFAYQIINSELHKVEVAFKIISKNSFGFKIISDYDSKYDLIIDPVILEWSTFLGGGGNGNGYIFDIKVDSAGYVYTTGYYNENFPVTPGVYDTSYNQGGSCGFGGAFEDVFVAKLNPDATQIIWATYVGGSCAERGRGIAIDQNGDCYVTGWTKSTDFPKVNSIQAALNGSTDAIAFKLINNGTVLTYSSCFGGNYNEWGEKIAINTIGEAYMTGATLDNGTAQGFPTTPSSFQPAYGGGAYQCDAYVSKLNANGSLQWSSYLGGSMWDWGYGIDVDQNGICYVTGRAQTGFPTTPGSFQTTNNGSDDVFVTSIDPSGVFKIYSTMVGGSITTNGSCGCETGNFITVNSLGETYVSGNVRSSDFPTTTGVYDATFNNGYYGDAFVLKLNAAGSNLIFSTYLGGSTLDIGWGHAVDSAGNVYVSGYTDAVDYPTTDCAFDSTYNGTIDGDFFIARFNADASELKYSSLIGGSDQDYWEPKVCVLGSECDERIVFCGTTHSQNFPTTSGTIQPVKLNAVNDQPVLFKMKQKIYPGFISPSTGNCNVAINFTDTTSSCGLWENTFTTHHWIFSDGTTDDGISVNHTFVNPGTYYITLIVGCPVDSITKQIVITCNNAPVVVLASSDTVFCDKQSIDFFDLSTNNPTSWQWTFTGATPNSSTDQNPTGIFYPTSGSFDVQLIACNSNGCDTLLLQNFVTEYPSPYDSIWQSNDTLYSLPAIGYQWYETTTGLIVGATTQFYVTQQSGSYFCVITDSIGCVGTSNTIVITSLTDPPAPQRRVLTIVPNPNDGNFEIILSDELTLSNCILQITDVLGQVIYKQVLVAKNKKFNLKVNSGIYFVKLIATEYEVSSTLIIKP